VEKSLSIKTVKIKKIRVIENADVYDIKVNKNHNFFANNILVHNCGEQPLPNETSCNLGSINLERFVDEAGIFNWSEFHDQIIRATYYLDLVIDVTKYPLEIIEKRTKAIRPIGLGIMGLADACIKMGIKYGSEDFYAFCTQIAKKLAVYSLISSAAIAAKKGSYNEWKSTSNMIEKVLNLDYNLDTDESLIRVSHDIVDSVELPISFRYAISELVNGSVEKTLALETLRAILCESGLRNSRRLSIAPTGTISLLLNTSSSIEPNFAYEWTRTVTVNESKKETLNYYHRMYSEENKNKGLLISAHDLSPEQHARVVKCFAPYIDSAISKTVNLPSEATVKDVKDVYMYCYKNGIKGITIYRDGSRNEQPIRKEDSNSKNTMNSTDESLKVNEVKESTNSPMLRKRPKIMHGLTTKSDSPYGSIYITANFDDRGKMFETFISAGKSGSVSKSITEALSRVISLALRSGVNINDIIKTISNISGSEVWVYDNIDGEEVIVKSIPDAAAKMLTDLSRYESSVEVNQVVKLAPKPETAVSLDVDSSYKFGHVESVCPECGLKMIPASGCAVCGSCGYSSCK